MRSRIVSLSSLFLFQWWCLAGVELGTSGVLSGDDAIADRSLYRTSFSATCDAASKVILQKQLGLFFPVLFLLICTTILQLLASP